MKMERQDVVAIIILHWVVFALALFIMWMVMDTNNLTTELQYMKQYNDAITTENLQDIMCNGNPV